MRLREVGSRNVANLRQSFSRDIRAPSHHAAADCESTEDSNIESFFEFLPKKLNFRRLTVTKKQELQSTH